MAKRQNPMAAMMEMVSAHEANEKHVHPLSAEAQIENLRSAWAHYTAPKSFKPGDLCRDRDGLGTFNDDPVLLFARMLNPANEQDRVMIDDATRSQRWNKVDCIVARGHGEGTITFFVHDSDLLEPLTEAV